MARQMQLFLVEVARISDTETCQTQIHCVKRQHDVIEIAAAVQQPRTNGLEGVHFAVAGPSIQEALSYFSTVERCVEHVHIPFEPFRTIHSLGMYFYSLISPTNVHLI